MPMKRFTVVVAFILTALPVFASSLGTAARTVIPVDVQQIINVDYRQLKGSDTAMAMKAKLLPPNMKQFEDALKGVGVVPDRDLEQITLASFRTKKQGLDIIGIAQGQFPLKTVNLRLAKQKIKGEKEGAVTMYPMSGGMTMTFLDDFTMLFGSKAAVEAALEARDNSGQSLNANSDVTSMIASVDHGTVWSVLDANGTQVMMKSVLGAAANLTEFDTVKSKLLGSRYSMDFNHGVDFNLNVVTSDSVTASTLSSLLKAGMMFKKANATPLEKTAMDSTTVDSDAGRLIVHFKADDNSFKSLLDSQMFVAVTK
jgi:hypothetical protein